MSTINNRPVDVLKYNFLLPKTNSIFNESYFNFFNKLLINNGFIVKNIEILGLNHIVKDDIIKIIISQLAVFISKQNVFIFWSILFFKHSSDEVNISFKKSELYLPEIFKKVYKDHVVKDIKPNPKIAKISKMNKSLEYI